MNFIFEGKGTGEEEGRERVAGSKYKQSTMIYTYDGVIIKCIISYVN